MLTPTRIEVQKKSRRLAVTFDDGYRALIPFGVLRQNTPSAEGAPPEIDDDIAVRQVELVGNYALRPHFSDGHQSGLYSWALLYRLGKQ